MSTATDAAPRPADDDDTAPARPAGRPWHARVAWTPLLAVVVYLALVVSGVTTSSIGADLLRQNPAASEDSTLGTPRAVRSDEWLTATPSLLGITASGDTDVTTTPLADNPDLVLGIPTAGGAGSVVFFDVELLRLGTVLPDASLFAALWWLPYLLVVLALPPWLRRLGANVPLSWLGTGLVLFAPATAWWSGTPVKIIGFSVAACLLAMKAAETWWSGRRLLAVVPAVVGGILLARVPTLYQPWVVVLAVPIVLATLLWLLRTPGRRASGLLVGAAVAVVGGGLFVGLVVANLDAYRAALSTVYPGRRRATGGPNPFSALFGAPTLGFLQGAPPVVNSNPSELSGGFTLSVVWAAFVAAAAGAVRRPVPAVDDGRTAEDPTAAERTAALRLDRAPDETAELSTAELRAAEAADRGAGEDGERDEPVRRGEPEVAGGARPGRPARRWRGDWSGAPLALLVLATAGWMLWSTTSWGSIGLRLPGINLVPPARSVQVVGYLGVLVLAVVLSRTAGDLDPTARRRRALFAAVAVAGVTLYAGSALQPVLPTLTTVFVVAVGLLVGVLVFLVTWQPERRRWVALTLVAAFAGVVTVNPLQVGLGDLRDSAAAQKMLAVGQQARAADDVWASDGIDTDGLLLATGVPSLTGHQMTGPDDAVWRRLDPTGRYESIWNRGASYVEMVWSQDPTATVTLGTTPDQIVVTVDPCSLDGDGFALGGVVSRQALTNSCLVPDGQIEWSGAPRYLYRVS